MIELELQRELYSQPAIESAAGMYRKFATIELEPEAERIRVRVASNGEFSDTEIADEFLNYALGSTIEEVQRSAS